MWEIPPKSSVEFKPPLPWGGEKHGHAGAILKQMDVASSVCQISNDQGLRALVFETTEQAMIFKLSFG